MIRLTGHGGGCCGIIHFHNFERFSKWQMEWIDDKIKDFDAYSRSACHLFEIVLTNGQAKTGWHKALLNYGFKEVNRFRNKNSYSLLHVYHYTLPHNEREREKLE